MTLLEPLATPALAASATLLLGLLALRARQRRSSAPAPQRETLDTIADWPPEPVRVLTASEREGLDLLQLALPGRRVLAQVPLSRFLRVPTRHAYSEWLRRVGSLSADLLVCDANARVIAAIDIRSPQETERSRRRHERLTRVLEAADIPVCTWREGRLPTVAQIRATLGAELGADPLSRQARSQPAPAGATPLIPVAEIEEILVEGDLALGDAMEPVPSAFFEDFAPAAPSARR